MTTLPFPQVWANASESRRPPTTQENANGWPCGAADPDLFDYMFNRLQEVDNNLAGQIIYAATQRNVVYGENDNESLHRVLQTYEDIIKSDMVLNVPADHDDVADAVEYLSNFRIANSASVIINVAEGVYNHGTKIIGGHPDGMRIRVVGPAPNSGMVTASNFQVTGSTEANVATDRAVNENMLRGRFNVIIQSSGDGCAVGTDNIIFENILFVGSGSGNGVKTNGGLVQMVQCSVHNYEQNYHVERNGIIFADGCTASGALYDGFLCANNGTILNNDGVSVGNGNCGYKSSVGGIILCQRTTCRGNNCNTNQGAHFVSIMGFINAKDSTCSDNADDGFIITLDGTLQAHGSICQNNGGWGYRVLNGGRMNAGNTNSSGNVAGDYKCNNFGDMTITGYGGNAVTSPAVNTVGNGNCYIKN